MERMDEIKEALVKLLENATLQKEYITILEEENEKLKQQILKLYKEIK